jgi:hypothetical protein
MSEAAIQVSDRRRELTGLMRSMTLYEPGLGSLSQGSAGVLSEYACGDRQAVAAVFEVAEAGRDGKAFFGSHDRKVPQKVDLLPF